MNSLNSQLRVALVGCGQIADAHLQEIRKIGCARLVAVCDVHQDLADQAALRFEAPRAFHDMQQMVAETSPDVVHLTTPAQTHCPLTCQLLESGAHVYVEKPFTIDLQEAVQVQKTAEQVGRSICVGHDQLFDPAWLECRELVRTGTIGEVAHIESVLGYPLNGQFGRQVASDANHWVRQLPGGLFHNTLSHPLYRITDLLTDERPQIDAHWFPGSPGMEFPTEFVAHLRGERITGSLLFSTRVEPQRITRVYGSRGAIEVDFNAQVVRSGRQSSLPGAFGKLEAPFRDCREAARSLRRNLWRFWKGDLQYFAGMRNLFERFYRSILDRSPPPIAVADMVRVTGIMDEMFQQCRDRDLASLRPSAGTHEPRMLASATPTDVSLRRQMRQALEVCP